MAKSLFSLLRMLVISYIKYTMTYFLLYLTSLKVAAHAGTDVHNTDTEYERQHTNKSTNLRQRQYNREYFRSRSFAVFTG